MPINILGLNAYHGDSSAAMLLDGYLTAAIEEERLNRVKHWAGLPSLAVKRCMSLSAAPRIDHLAVSRNPGANIQHKILRVLANPQNIIKVSDRVSNGVRIARVREDLQAAGVGGLQRARIHFVEHHRAHMASAFFASPFEESAVVSIDGFGDFSSLMWGVGRGNRIEVRGAVRFPHSLGLFYTAFTQFLGFPQYGDEYKMMGLAAYGEPSFMSRVRRIVSTERDQIQLNLDYFSHHVQGIEMSWHEGEPKLSPVWSRRFIEAFGEPRRPQSELTQSHKDLAASAQAVLEENYFALLNFVQKQTGLHSVCLAGGVALNCVANGKIFEKTPFKDVYVQPAANDAGTSLGAALYVWNQVLGKPRNFVMRDVYYGPEYREDQIVSALEASGARYRRLAEPELIDHTARALAEGKIVGWCQGRMEFGPRALGNRSILADPRRAEMKNILNNRIKYREPFRPFCPSILRESVGDYFETDHPSPFMVMAYRVRADKQRQIPAVTHGDGTGRLQTVENDVNPLYWKLLQRFRELTGVPVLINTSFNENEPVVETPQQAIDCFQRTQMDLLVAGPFLAVKTDKMETCESHNKAFAEQYV
jgi:carbamoyltransferase